MEKQENAKKYVVPVGLDNEFAGEAFIGLSEGQFYIIVNETEKNTLSKALTEDKIKVFFFYTNDFLNEDKDKE